MPSSAGATRYLKTPWQDRSPWKRCTYSRFRQAAADFGQTVSRQEALDFQTAYQWQQNHISALSRPWKSCLRSAGSGGAFLGIITNGPSLHQRDKCRALGLSRWIGEEHILASGDHRHQQTGSRHFPGSHAALAAGPGDHLVRRRIPMTTISVELPGPAGIPFGWDPLRKKMNRKSLRPTSE